MEVIYHTSSSGATLEYNGVIASVIKSNPSQAQTIKAYQIPGYSIFLIGCNDPITLKVMADFYLNEVVQKHLKFYTKKYAL